ncbi:JHL23C [Salix suchowensis]|nr:JHL23C [Salix suchowensis]
MLPTISTSVSASSTSESSESRRIIQSEEITFEDFTKHLDNWKIPSISQSQIYKKSKYDIFKTDFTIKTEERDIQLTKPFETIQLLTQKSLQKHLDRNYKYIHIGCVQVGIKPLTKEGLNTSVLAVLRDARFINFEDSLLSSIESSLCNGPLSFDCYPNLTVSLKDKNILKSMQLQIKTHNYHMLEDSVPVALIFKIHYKAMFSAFASKHLQHSNKGSTLLLQTDLSKANIVVPKAIQWKEITLPEEWILEEATPPQPIPQPQPNVQIRNITQYNDGRVKLSFHRHSTSSRYTEASSSSSTIDLGRMSRIPSVINLPYIPSTNPPRHSTSDIPSTNLHRADYTTNIPTPVYTHQEQEQSLPGSPTSITSSAMPDNIPTELLVITSEDFVLDKSFFKADFFSDQNTERRKWFFKTFTSERSKVQTKFYAYITLHQSSMLFFDWFELHYAPAHNITYPFASTKHTCPITTRSKTSTWNLSSGQTIESDHPPLRHIQIEYQNHPVEAIPYKVPSDDTLTNTKNIILQNNFTNTNLGTIRNTVQDAVACLILTISLHFIGDPSHLKDKNAELLSNLRCKKLSDFQWYKNTFMTRVMLREDSNQPFWKEKFLAGLPILLGEKVRNKIKDSFSTKLIPYDQLTYGELVSFTQKEGLKICQDLKLQKQLKWEMKRTKQELGSFCHQFDISTSKPSCSGNCSKSKTHHETKPPYKRSSHKYRKHYQTKYHSKEPQQPYYKKPYKNFTQHTKNHFHTKTKPFDWKTATCYKCNQKGHTAAFCKVQKKLHELNIDEDTINMIQNLYLETSDTDPSSSDISEEEFQVDELADSSATSDTSKSNEVSVLTQDQEFILEAIKRLDDPQLQRVYLDNLLRKFETAQPPVNPPTRTTLPSTSTNTYYLTKILSKKKTKTSITIPELHSEIKTLKT